MAKIKKSSFYPFLLYVTITSLILLFLDFFLVKWNISKYMTVGEFLQPIIFFCVISALASFVLAHSDKVHFNGYTGNKIELYYVCFSLLLISLITFFYSLSGYIFPGEIVVMITLALPFVIYLVSAKISRRFFGFYVEQKSH